MSKLFKIDYVAEAVGGESVQLVVVVKRVSPNSE